MSADPPAVPTTGLLLYRSATAKLKNILVTCKSGAQNNYGNIVERPPVEVVTIGGLDWNVIESI